MATDEQKKAIEIMLRHFWCEPIDDDLFQCMTKYVIGAYEAHAPHQETHKPLDEIIEKAILAYGDCTFDFSALRRMQTVFQVIGYAEMREELNRLRKEKEEPYITYSEDEGLSYRTCTITEYNKRIKDRITA